MKIMEGKFFPADGVEGCRFEVWDNPSGLAGTVRVSVISHLPSAEVLADAEIEVSRLGSFLKDKQNW